MNRRSRCPRLTGAVAGIVLWAAGPAGAFNQPILNLGFTSMMDGGPTAPGVYFLEYVRNIDTTKAVDSTGATIPGGARVSGLISLTQLRWDTDVRVLGGNFGVDVLLPMIGLLGQGSLGGTPVTTNSNGPGDLYVGSHIQWNDTKLLGRPFGHFVEVGVSLPTGKYDPAFTVNPGNHVVTIYPFYSFTWLFTDTWETSWKFNYATHTQNPRTHLRPGDSVLVAYELSRELHPKFRLGAGGYYLQQVTDDRAAGAGIPGSRERSVSVGPVVGYLGAGLTAFVSYFAEVDTRSRFQSNNTTVQLIHKF